MGDVPRTNTEWLEAWFAQGYPDYATGVAAALQSR
jgi:hypothetical protein